jgi:predicted transposase YbfD/YdcC
MVGVPSISFRAKKVNKKSNEVTAIPALLELLEIEKSIITIDARLMS